MYLCASTRYLFLALILASLICEAEDRSYLADQKRVQFTRISMEHGLSQAFVTAIAQDDSGFMWIGTQEGLNRHDGIEFSTYYNIAGESTSLSHDNIWSLHVDTDGRLWVGTDIGLDYYHSETDSFVRVIGSTGEVRVINEDSKGNLWIGSSHGLWKVDEFDKVSRIESATLHQHNSGGIRGVTEQSPGKMIVGSERRGLYLYDVAEDRLTPLTTDSSGASLLADPHVRDVLVDSNGDLWIGTFNGGLSHLSGATGEVKIFGPKAGDPRSLSSNRVRRLFEDSGGNIWVGVDGGLHLWLPDSGNFLKFAHDRTDPRSIGDNFIVELFEDRGGVLWVGTFNGLNKWNSKVEMFPYFKRPYASSEVLPSENVTSFVGDVEGNVWIGTLEGLMKWNSETAVLSSIPSAELELSDTRVMSLEWRNGQVWMGTMAGGINLLEDGKIVRRFRHDASEPSSLSSDAVPEIFIDSRERVWVGTYGGGLNLYLGNGKFKRFPVSDGRSPGFPDGRCMDVVEGLDGKVWIGTDGGGVVRLDPETGDFIVFSADTNDEGSLSSDNIIALHYNHLGVWVGTLDKGLNLLNPETGLVKRFSKSDGLASDAIYGMLEDDLGNLWLSSAKGLSQLDLKTQRFTNFDASHGLQGSDFNSGAYAKLSDGSLLFGGSRGFNAFYPGRISMNNFVPPVALTGFSLFNEPQDLHSILDDTGVLKLLHNHTVIGFSFAALDFTAPEKNQYRYKLEGFDRDWVHHQGNREVTYTNLDAGDYVFRVQGSNNDGVWNEQGASLPLIVKPAPWLTWWAYTIYAAVAVMGFAYLFRLNSERLKREAERRYSERLQLYIESLEEASDCILIADASGTLMYANNTITEGLNKSPSEVIGESLWKIIFEEEDDVVVAQEALLTDGRYHGEVQLEGLSGEPVTHEVTIAAVQQSSTNDLAYVGISRDVTERKVTEAELEDYRKNLEVLVEDRTAALQKEIAENKQIQVRLEDSLQEKELLIKEVHHRVKNNMQVISSLLSIQAEGAGDDTYSDLLNESQQRIKSMALIHETLYQSKDLLKIDFQEYIETLTSSLGRSYTVPGVSVHVAVNVEDVELDLETAVPCGLIINELASNALKHAFHGMQGTGIIDISFVSNDCHYDLRIADNGCGLPDEFDPNKNMSMGLEIVSILTTQLEGKLKSHNEEGAVFDIRFPRRANV